MWWTRAKAAAGNLLLFLVEKISLTQAQAVKGFKRLFDRVDDLVLDAPNARQVLAKYTAWAIQEDASSHLQGSVIAWK